MSLNVLIPVVVVSLLSPGTKTTHNKHITEASETDRFMIEKGGNVTLGEAKKKREFWLALMTFAIVIGISRMIDENATMISLNN